MIETTARLRRDIRGVALAETAIMISFTLLMLFSTMQFGILGYFQVAGDSATFIGAHEYTLGIPQASITSIENQMVPHTIAAAVTFVPSAPPSVDPSIFTTIYGGINQSNRNSGYTLVRPQNFQAALSGGKYNGVFGFSNVPVTAGAVEGYYLMASQQMNNAGVGPNDPLAVGSTVLNPTDASPFLPQSDASIYNMNTPPYYLPSPTIMLCTAPWNGAGGTAFGQTCAGGGDVPWFIGLGEYLSNYNYGQPSVDVNFGGAFQAMAAHQRVYAKLITAFPTIGGVTPLLQEANLQSIQKQFQNYAATNSALAPCIPPACGALWTPSPVVFPNGAGNLVSSPTVPLYYYDAMLYWINQSAYTGPGWNPRTMWSNENAAHGVTLAQDAANDGPLGPAAWGNASFALVYYWDQPNYPPRPTAPGAYPTHPLGGSQAAGDPAYQ